MLQELGPQSYHLLLEARLNGGEPAMFVVDTGASRSVVDAQLMPTAVPTADAIEAYGISTDSVQVQVAQGVELCLCDGQWTQRVDLAVADLSALRELYKSTCGINIVGLLGCDFLLAHCSTINLGRRTLTLRRADRRGAKIVDKNSPHTV